MKQPIEKKKTDKQKYLNKCVKTTDATIKRNEEAVDLVIVEEDEIMKTLRSLK